MKDVLQYKDYLGSVHFNADDEIFYGKIECIDDLISFEGATVDELKTAFIDAVEDYIDLCKPNEKSYKGSFNIRISPAVHKQAKRLAVMQGISLNQFIQQAVEQAITLTAGCL